MSQEEPMNLKILYVLEDGNSGTYLTRSKTPYNVKIANISENNGSQEVSSKIGMVYIAAVLKEIFNSSPELLNNKVSQSGYDFNLYFKDACEFGEPFVSLGLLSKIRKVLKSQYLADKNNQDFIGQCVTGRVRSTLGGMFKTPGTKMLETLEIKLRFSKVMSFNSSKKSQNQTKDSNNNMKSNNNNTDSLKNKIEEDQKKANEIAKSIIKPTNRNSRISKNNNSKRLTNPKPAPKAKRTQSMPVCTPKNQANSGPFKNSIAHKIFLADRLTETSQQQQQNSKQILTYDLPPVLTANNNINNNNNNSNQKSKVEDDSISKRFEFMLNNKKKTGRRQSVSNNNNNKVLSSTRATRMNTTPIMPITSPSVNEHKESKQNNRTIKNIDNNNNEALIFNHEFEEEVDKENLPPINFGEFSKVEKIKDMEFNNFQDFGDMGWLNDYNPFNSPHLDGQFNQLNNPNTTTPNDVNILSIESSDPITGNENNKQNNNQYHETEKTSPMSTLSILEMSEHPDSGFNYDQERTSPIIPHSKLLSNRDLMDKDTPGSDSSSPAVISRQPLKKTTRKIMVSIRENSVLDDMKFEENDGEDNYHKQGTMPSSPTTSFSYDNLSTDIEGFPDPSKTDALFKSYD